MPNYDFRHVDNITVVDTIGPEPENEQEELEARRRITTAMLVAWYNANHIRLDVSLFDYVPGES
jgi:hypothetical protein